jgi:biopolymer transport protein ExbD
MAIIRGRADAQAYADINMTPLIDVMLVLLIIFIITIPVQTDAVKIDNPSPAQPPMLARDVIDLSIDFDGTLFWNQQPLERKALQELIGQAAGRSPQPEVHIRVDRYAKYAIVAQTLADLQRRGLKMIGFVNNEYL